MNFICISREDRAGRAGAIAALFAMALLTLTLFDSLFRPLRTSTPHPRGQPCSLLQASPLLLQPATSSVVPPRHRPPARRPCAPPAAPRPRLGPRAPEPRSAGLEAKPTGLYKCEKTGEATVSCGFCSSLEQLLLGSACGHPARTWECLTVGAAAAARGGPRPGGGWNGGQRPKKMRAVTSGVRLAGEGRGGPAVCACVDRGV